MQPVYIHAHLLHTPQILGRRLLPLSLGHALVLDIIGSPYVVGGPVGLGDIQAAVWLCSLPFEEAVAELEDQAGLLRKVSEWGKEAGRGADWVEIAAALRVYLDFYEVQPAR